MKNDGREWLLERLEGYEPFDGHEARMLAELTAFVREQEACFSRALAIGHITGSAWVLDATREYTLLTHHHQLDRWLQLGGHLEGDGTVLEGAWREAREESGIEGIVPVHDRIFDVDIHPIPARGTTVAHFHYDVRFVFEADRSLPLRVTGESKALEWVRLDAVAGLNSDASVMRMVDKTRRGMP